MVKNQPINNSKLSLNLKQFANLQAELVRSTNKGEKMKKKKDEGYCAYLASARMAIDEEQPDDALEFYDQAISSKDCEPSVYYLKCELLFQMNRIAEALNLMTRYGQKNGNVISAYFHTAKYFEKIGKLDEASFFREKYSQRVYGNGQTPSIIKKHLSLFLGGI